MTNHERQGDKRKSVFFTSFNCHILKSFSIFLFAFLCVVIPLEWSPDVVVLGGLGGFPTPWPRGMFGVPSRCPVNKKRSAVT